jgi:hypothetical protein
MKFISNSFRLSATIFDAPFLNEFTEADCGIPLGSTELADIFEVRSSRVRTISVTANKRGRVTIVGSNSKFIRKKRSAVWSYGNSATQRQVLDFAEAEFRKTLPYGWLDSLLHQHPRKVRRAILAPQELPRLQIPRSSRKGDLT